MSMLVDGKRPIRQKTARNYTLIKLMLAGLLGAILFMLLLQPPTAAVAPQLNPIASVDEPQSITLTGKGAPNSLVAVALNGAEIGIATVDEAGNWSLTTDELEPGSYTATVSAVADGSNERDFVSAQSWEIEEPTVAQVVTAVPSITPAPPRAAELVANAPRLDAFSADGQQTSTMLNWSGTGEPGATVQLLANGVLIDRVTVDDDGMWAFSGQYSLDPGDVALELQMTTDDDQFDMLEAATVTIPDLRVTTVTPTLTLGDDATAGRPFSLDGTAAPNSDVEILIDGEVLGTVLADEDGQFSYETSLPSGDYSVTAQTADGTSAAQILSIATFAAQIASVEVDDILTLRGSAEAEREVQLTANGEPVATVVADGAGEFTFQVEPAAGVQTFAVRYSDDPLLTSPSLPLTFSEGGILTTVRAATVVADDAVAVRGSAPLSATVELLDESGAVIATTQADATGSFELDVMDDSAELTVRTTTEDGVMVAVRAVPTVAAPSSTIVASERGLSGSGVPGEQIIILNGEREIGRAVVQANGVWLCPCPRPPGEYEISTQVGDDAAMRSEPQMVMVENQAQMLDEARPTSSDDPPVRVVCEGTPPFGTVRGSVYIVARCEYLTLIAQRIGTSYSRLLQFNPQITSPSDIFVGQAINIPPGSDILQK